MGIGRVPQVVVVLAVATRALAAPSAPAPVDRSVLVMSLEAKTGVAKDMAELLSENLATEVRQARVFTRVVTLAEIEAAVGLEQRKQLMNCNTQSCMAEIAASMQVRYLISGNLGKLGASYVMNLKLIEATSGVALASASPRVSGNSEEALLDAIRPAVDSIIRDANLPRLPGAPAPAPGPPARAPAPVAGPQPAPAPAPASPPAASAQAEAAAVPAAADEAKGGRTGLIVAALGACGLLPVLLLAGVAMGAAGFAGYVLETMFVGAVPFVVSGVPPTAKLGMAAGSGAAGGVAALLALVGVAASVAVMVVGLVVLR